MIYSIKRYNYLSNIQFYWQLLTSAVLPAYFFAKLQLENDKDLVEPK